MMSPMHKSSIDLRSVDLKQNPEAHHNHLHAADLTLYWPRSVAAGQLDRTQTSQKIGFENHNTTVFLIIFYGPQYQKPFLIQHQQNYFYPTVQECFQKHRGQLWWVKIAF